MKRDFSEWYPITIFIAFMIIVFTIVGLVGCGAEKANVVDVDTPEILKAAAVEHVSPDERHNTNQYRFEIVTLEYRGESHEFVWFYRKGAASYGSASHWPGCKYCKAKER